MKGELLDTSASSRNLTLELKSKKNMYCTIWLNKREWIISKKQSTFFIRSQTEIQSFHHVNVKQVFTPFRHIYYRNFWQSPTSVTTTNSFKDTQLPAKKVYPKVLLNFMVLAFGDVPLPSHNKTSWRGYF